MKSSEIKKGMTVYQIYSDGSSRAVEPGKQTILKYFILDVVADSTGNKALASCNGGPPQWFNKMKYKHWTAKKPLIKT